MKALGINDVDQDFDNYEHHSDSYALKYNYERNFEGSFQDQLFEMLDNELEKEMLKYPPVLEVKGAKRLIDNLQYSEYAFAFATGAFPKPSLIKLKQANIWHHESLLSTSKTSISREGFVLQAIDQAKRYFGTTDFENIISVGDGLWDLQTARNLDLQFIGIGNKNRDILVDNGSDYWFEDMQGLEKHLF